MIFLFCLLLNKESALVSHHSKPRNDDDEFPISNEIQSNQMKVRVTSDVHVANVSTPSLKLHDKIFFGGRKMNQPHVLQDYKLIFFSFPKVGCTEWRQLARKALGLPRTTQSIHDPKTNGLRYISDYSLEEAQEMITSPDWTRAVFIREPKERVLSAFLDKFVGPYPYFEKHGFCSGFEQICKKKQKEKNFSFFLNLTLSISDVHWRPQRNLIDEKWWPYIDYIGFMHNISNDAKTLLQRVKHSATGTTLWEDVARTGWGEEGKFAFMETARHGRIANNAKDRLREYYTPCLEMFVEKHWAKEWESGLFEPFQLFNATEYPSYEGCEIQ